MLQKNISMPDDQTRHVVAEVSINSIFDVDKMLYFVSPEWWRPRRRSRSRQAKATTDDGGHGGPGLGIRSAEVALSNGVFAAARRVAANATPTLRHSSTVGWGGVDDPSRDSYYITSDSDPAR